MILWCIIIEHPCVYDCIVYTHDMNGCNYKDVMLCHVLVLSTICICSVCVEHLKRCKTSEFTGFFSRGMECESEVSIQRRRFWFHSGMTLGRWSHVPADWFNCWSRCCNTLFPSTAVKFDNLKYWDDAYWQVSVMHNWIHILNVGFARSSLTFFVNRIR